MANIELFDKYINGELSEKEMADFKNLLEEDKDFAIDFNIYSLSIIGICKEAEQDNMDFGVAMKKLTKEQLKNIVGKPKARPTNVVKKFSLRPWIWQAASIAAVVVIAFTYSFNVQRNARYSVDNAIYACADVDFDMARSGGEEPIDITKLSDKELQEAIPALQKAYRNATENEDIATTGYALAMTFIRLHNRADAKSILDGLIQRFDNNPDFCRDVAKWKSIRELIK